MKKILILVALAILLTGCSLVKTDQTKTTGQPETKGTTVTQDASLEGMEKELTQTPEPDFDQEIQKLDTDINQL